MGDNDEMRRALRSTLIVAAAAVAVALAAACASFSGDDATTADGGDGSPGTDGSDGADGAEATDADAAAPSADFCAEAGWICDDFDHPPATWPTPPWDTADKGALTALTLTDASVASAPNSAEITLETDGGALGLFLSSSFNGPLTGVRCTFKLQLLEPGVTGLDVFILDVLSGSAPLYYASMATGPGNTGFYAGGSAGTINAFDIGGLQTQKWHTFVVEAHFGGGTRLAVNGAVVVQPDASVSPAGTGTNARLRLGLGHSGNDTKTRVRYDDVRCDALR